MRLNFRRIPPDSPNLAMHPRRGTIKGCVALGLGAIVCFVFQSPVSSYAQTDPIPKGLQGVEIVEHLNDQIPLNLQFVDQEGETVTLSKYFNKDRPVVLLLGYYSCPMLCDLVLRAALEGLVELGWSPGEKYELVYISINPLETAQLAKLNKQNYMKEYGLPGAMQGWHFHVGSEANIRQIAETTGFGFKYNEERGEYAHAAGIMICTPDGRLSRYLYGIEYEPKTLKLALLEASEGKIGTTLDHFYLYCFQYDASVGRYAPVAMNIMRIGGVFTVLILAIVMTTLWLRDLRRKKENSEGTQP